jgi:hypothetical protein
MGKGSGLNQLIVVLITAVVTGIVSISGIWFGSYLTRGTDTEKWRRDHALETYYQMVEAVQVVLTESDRIYITAECGTDNHVKQGEVVLAKMFLERDPFKPKHILS